MTAFDNVDFKKMNTIDQTGNDGQNSTIDKHNRTGISFPKLSESVVRTGEGPRHFQDHSSPLSARRETKYARFSD